MLPPMASTHEKASPVAPLWLRVGKPFSCGQYFVTISMFAPKPPVAITTAFAFSWYVLPSRFSTFTPHTLSPSIMSPVTLLLVRISTFSDSEASFSTFIR